MWLVDGFDSYIAHVVTLQLLLAVSPSPRTRTIILFPYQAIRQIAVP